MYLERETGYEYDVDSLQDLCFASELDVFFRKTCIIYDQYLYSMQPLRQEVGSELISPPPLYVASKAHTIDGIFLLKNVCFNEGGDKFVQFNAEVVVEKVFRQKDILFDNESAYKYSEGDVGYLSNAEFNELHFLPNCQMDTKPLRDKALTSINYSELKFKKTQLDRLIINSKPEFLDLEYRLEKATDELKNAYGIMKKIQSDNSVLSEQTERSYMITIGLLLELLTTPKTEGRKPLYPSEATIITNIVEKNIHGQGKTTVAERFKIAKEKLNTAKKK